MINALSKAGLENFSQYGKLIGTGKNNGIKVYEKLANGERVLTSVKDDAVRKVVTKYGRKVTVDNKATGETFTVSNYNDCFSFNRQCDDASEYLSREKVNNGVKGTYEKYVKNGDASILELKVDKEPSSIGPKITIRSHTGVNIGGQNIPEYENHRFYEDGINPMSKFRRDPNTSIKSLDQNLAEAIWNAFRKLLS